jgi:hypothetical protein
MKCKFCGEEKKLIRAHIIPEGFLRRLRDGQDPPRILAEKDFPKKAPIGVYDTSILGADCEKLFGDWDNHIQRILATEPIGEPIKNNEDTIAYKIENFNYEQIKLFCISLLWRASASSKNFYKHVKLGPYDEIAKRHIIESNPGSEEDFSVTIAKFGDHPFDMTTMGPRKDKWTGVNFYRFYMASYVLYIKVDRRISPSPFDLFKVKKDQPIHIICRDLSKSKELPVILKLGEAANKKINRTENTAALN